jgi:hypothetical protein
LPKRFGEEHTDPGGVEARAALADCGKTAAKCRNFWPPPDAFTLAQLFLALDTLGIAGYDRPRTSDFTRRSM